MLVSVSKWETGIWLTQVGYPLAHCQEGVLYCVSLDRFAGLAGLAVAVGKDKEVADLGFGVGNRTEAWGSSMGGTEVGPDVEDLVSGRIGFGGGGLGGERKSSAEVRLEIESDGSWSGRQDPTCR